MPNWKNEKQAVEELVTGALTGGLSRRRFMEGAMSMGLTIAAASTCQVE